MNTTQVLPQQFDPQMDSMATILGATNISMSRGDTATIAGSRGSQLRRRSIMWSLVCRAGRGRWRAGTYMEAMPPRMRFSGMLSSKNSHVQRNKAAGERDNSVFNHAW